MLSFIQCLQLILQLFSFDRRTQNGVIVTSTSTASDRQNQSNEQ